MVSHLIENSEIDLRFESFRVQNPTREKRLLGSIQSNDIQVPLDVIHDQECDRYILLDGFKRYRAAQKLGIRQLPVNIVGTSEVEGLLRIIRHNDQSSLSGFEQACFVEQLHMVHHLSISEIAGRVDRSISWVRLRIEMLKSMSDTIREKIASGAFPLRSYLYELGPVTRVRGNAPVVEQFVKAVSGRDYSTRDIARLSRAYFSGDEMVQKQITDGNIDWTLRMLKDKDNTAVDKDDSVQQQFERSLYSCLWHFNHLLDRLQSDSAATWLCLPTIQSLLGRLRENCTVLLKLHN